MRAMLRKEEPGLDSMKLQDMALQSCSRDRNEAYYVTSMRRLGPRANDHARHSLPGFPL
jgi:hypothetical protein